MSMPTHKHDGPDGPDNPNRPSGPLTPGAGSNGGPDDFMTMHQQPDPESVKMGYERTDANVRDIAGFLVVLACTIAVVFVLAFGIWKLIYQELARVDGPATKWHQMAGVTTGNLESDPQIEQQQLRQLANKFPTPRLQLDDGNVDVAEMHAREDMLLNYYSWVDQKQQIVRIPIERAMQIVAQKGLPVESQQGPREQAMFGDRPETVTAPLTNGFARTGPELKMIEARDQRMGLGVYSETHAELPPAH